jgi:hypothetical protein
MDQPAKTLPAHTSPPFHHQHQKSPAVFRSQSINGSSSNNGFQTLTRAGALCQENIQVPRDNGTDGHG